MRLPFATYCLLEAALFVVLGVVFDDSSAYGGAAIFVLMGAGAMAAPRHPRRSWRRFQCRRLGIHHGPSETHGEYVYTKCRYCDSLRDPHRRQLVATIEDGDLE